jgi:hypothetical protein
MKKVWLAAALLGLITMASSVFADVQNIRLSGDVRIRGYFLQNANSGQRFYGPNRPDDVNRLDSSFIAQRTRITCEADLEDHVLVVMTLQAESTWGKDYPMSQRTLGSSVELTEAYVQFSEMFFTPATLKLGRQYLNYGRGLIVSSYDQVYNFDAGRLVLDFYPFTVDLVGAKLGEGNGNSMDKGRGGNDLLFINGRYEMKDSIIKNVEAYFGWASRASHSSAWNSSQYSPTANAASPWIIGLRTDLTPIKGLQVWMEAAYEGGQAPVGSLNITTPSWGPPAQDSTLSAFIANVGAKYTFKDVKMEPSVNVEYTFASGGGSFSGNGNAFVPWFDSKCGQNGYLFQPLLSNIHIFNVGASIKPAKNVTASLQAYYYLKADSDSFAGSNPAIDIGGLNGMTMYSCNKTELGAEIDAILSYDYSKDARFSLIYAAFIPDRAFTGTDQSRGDQNNAYTPYNSPGELYQHDGFDRVAHMIRAEVNVKF